MQTQCGPIPSLALEVNDPISFISQGILWEGVNIVGLDSKAKAIVVTGPQTAGRPRAFSLKDITVLVSVDFTTPSPLRPTQALFLTTSSD